jgi:hypothetical protein
MDMEDWGSPIYQITDAIVPGIVLEILHAWSLFALGSWAMNPQRCRKIITVCFTVRSILYTLCRAPVSPAEKDPQLPLRIESHLQMPSKLLLESIIRRHQTTFIQGASRSSLDKTPSFSKSKTRLRACSRCLVHD